MKLKPEVERILKTILGGVFHSLQKYDGHHIPDYDLTNIAFNLGIDPNGAYSVELRRDGFTFSCRTLDLWYVHDDHNHDKRVVDVTIREPENEVNVPSTLYKYRSFLNEGDNPKYDHLNILRNKQIFFSSPDRFNDPFDCLIPQRYDLLTLGEFHKKKIQIVYNMSHRNVVTNDWRIDRIPKNMSSEQSVDYYFSQMVDNPEYPQYTPEELIRMREFQIKHLRESATIFSLTPKNDHTLMWSHYSRNHTGFCIGFDKELLHKSTSEATLGRVEYVNYFNIKPVDNKRYHMVQVLSKSKVWEYEAEWRLIHWEKKSLYDIDPKCIKEVIVGCCASKDDVNKLSKILSTDDQLSHAKLYKAVQEPYSFNLKIEEMKREELKTA